MFLCPQCALKIRKLETTSGPSWGCPNCRGQLLPVQDLFRLMGAAEAKRFWALSAEPGPAGRPCPSCAQPLRTLIHEAGSVPVELDVCRRCELVWLDEGEDFRVSSLSDIRNRVAKSPESQRKHVEALAALARQRAEHAQEPGFVSGTGPEQVWKWVPALIGLPIEMEPNDFRNQPILTPLLALTLLFFFAWTLKQAHFEQILMGFGFISQDPFRLGGFTWLSSFFLHADWFHVLGNTYFLWVFSDDIENEVGALGLTALLAGCHGAGLVAQWLVTGASAIPLVGASAGVFGVLGYYMVRFSKAKVGVMYLLLIKPFWFRFSAQWLLVLKIAQEVLMTWLTGHVAGGGVAHAAHVGGAACGLAIGALARGRQAARI